MTLLRLFAVLTPLLAVASGCGSSGSRIRGLSEGKALASGFPIEAKKRLFAKVGLTNITFCGYGERDSTGDRICFPVEARDETGKRRDHLVVVTSGGVHATPWHIYNEKMTDNEQLAVWEEPRSSTNSIWRLGNGEPLPEGCYPLSVSAGWIALASEDGCRWLARLDTPTVVVAALPKSCWEMDIFAHGQTVHVFARRGWRNAEGPMRYVVYDFTRGTRPITEMVLPWARVVWDMDPETRVAVVNDSSSFFGAEFGCLI